MTTRPRTITVQLKGVDLVLTTSPGLFSPRHVDAGTCAMLSLVDFQTPDKVLDLGCGYGVIGILAAKLVGPSHVFLIDNDPLAVTCARQNAALNGIPELTVLQSDGFNDFTETHFTKVLCNPPYHCDFSVAKHFIHKTFNRLDLGGCMFMVTKYRDWYENKFRAVFGAVRTRQINGYNVFVGTKTSFTWASFEKRNTRAANQLLHRVRCPRRVRTGEKWRWL